MSTEMSLPTEQSQDTKTRDEEKGEQQQIQYDRIELEAQGQLKLPLFD